MSRTIREVKIIGKGLEEVKICDGNWFSTNGFRIREWDSKGRIFNAREWFSMLGAIIRLRADAMVAA